MRLAQTINLLRKSRLIRECELAYFRFQNRGKKKFVCPVCQYSGPFADINPETGFRENALCPKCRSAERHRLCYLVIMEISKACNMSNKSILHLAPEPFLAVIFKKMFKKYSSADLQSVDVDNRADLRKLPFSDRSFDFIFASHVLEHIKEDAMALSEISRVLKTDGIAVLPVPIVCDMTVEYPYPNLHEAGHVRSPGRDYYDRYMPYFSKISFYYSGDFPEHFQLYIHEDRTKWPDGMPLRPTMTGHKHPEIIPVCYK